MKNKQNPYLYATINTLIGIIVFIIIISLLKEFNLYTTIIVAIVLWVANFLSYKYLKNK